MVIHCINSGTQVFVTDVFNVVSLVPYTHNKTTHIRLSPSFYTVMLKLDFHPSNVLIYNFFIFFLINIYIF